MSSAEATADVIIVGYGPTGETLANLLGQAGLSVEVLEQSLEPHPLPRAVHLDAEAMRILQLIGLGEEAAGLCAPSEGMDYVDVDGRSVFSYEPFRRAPLLGWEQDWMVFQPDLDAALRAGAHRFPSVRVRLGAEVVAVSQDGTAVTATVATGRSVQGRYLVACDGASSTVRTLLGEPLEDLGYHGRWLVVDVELHRAVELPTRIQQICDPARAMTFIPGAGRHRRWEFAAVDGESNADLEQPDRVWELLAPWIGRDDGDLRRASVYSFHGLVAERFRLGRVFLAGDAAHQMPPFMGQGLCSGLRDVANLAWKLEAACRGPAPAALLATYEQERRPHAIETTRMSVETGHLLRLIAEASSGGLARVLPAPESQDPEAWSRLPHLRAGAFVPSSDPPPPIGRQARQPLIRTRTGALRLDDVCGRGFAVISRRPIGGGDFDPLPGGWVASSDVADVDGELDRMLGGHAGLIVRPDRYVFAAARREAELPALVECARAWVGHHMNVFKPGKLVAEGDRS